MSEPGPSRKTLDRNATRDTVLWGAGLSFATKIASIVLSLVLARLISPQLFGQYGVVSGLILLFMSFSLQSFAAHLFHQKDPKPEDYHPHLAFGIVLHGVLFLLANIVGLVMTFIPQYREIAVYVHVGSAAILINIPRIYYAAYLRIELQWRKARMLQLLSFALYATAALALAWAGHGVYALLAQNLLVPLPFVVAFFLDDKKLRALRFEWRAYRDSFTFGLLRTASGIVVSAQAALEGLAFSLLAGFGPLGLLVRARGMAQLATSWLSDQVSAILYPSLARLEPRSEEARRVAGLLLKIGLWTAAPVTVAMAMAERAAIYTLYGYQWGKVVPLVRPMLLAAVASSLFHVVRLVVLTNDGARKSLILDCLMTAANLACLIALAVSGIDAYAVWLGVVGAVTVAGMLTFMVRTGLILAGDFAAAASPGLILTVLGLLAATNEGYRGLEMTHPIPVLVATGAACGAAMLLLVRLIDPAGLAKLCGLLPGGRLASRWLFLPGPVTP